MNRLVAASLGALMVLGGCGGRIAHSDKAMCQTMRLIGAFGPHPATAKIAPIVERLRREAAGSATPLGDIFREITLDRGQIGFSAADASLIKTRCAEVGVKIPLGG